MVLKGAIFDLDGTLIDSMGMWDDIAIEFFDAHGITPPEGLIESLRTLTVSQTAQLINELFQLDTTAEELTEKFNKMAENHYIHHLSLKPHVIPLLNQLSETGVKMCVATATDRYLVEAVLTRLGIARYFDFIITCTEAGSGKEEPDIFNKALELLNARIEETIIFEDSDLSIKTAKKAGFTVVGVFDETFAALADEIKDIADYYINSFMECNYFTDYNNLKNLSNN